MTVPAPRHRAPPAPTRVAPWVWLTCAAVILIGAVVALAVWLGPDPDPPQSAPQPTVARSAAVRAMPSLAVPPLPSITTAAATPSVVRAEPSRACRCQPRTAPRTTTPPPPLPPATQEPTPDQPAPTEEAPPVIVTEEPAPTDTPTVTDEPTPTPTETADPTETVVVPLPTGLPEVTP